MENEPRNLTIGTLLRVAHALDSRVEIKLVRRKGKKPFEAPFVPPFGFAHGNRASRVNPSRLRVAGAAAKWRGKSQSPQPLNRRLRHPALR
jgi:hypothetical protein